MDGQFQGFKRILTALVRVDATVISLEHSIETNYLLPWQGLL